jgi:DNA integrity scanning protein DisA with diadenylate cyclase activity
MNVIKYDADLDVLILIQMISIETSLLDTAFVWIIQGNSSHSENIFKLQKRIIRIIMGARPRDSCRELFKF